ncbi:uroporphyrinogen-III synthase [Shinella pollutisoli]|uniref:Uroporphyrinogen-III synthase n=1 Tax=Shinella pollutisoli TaxID=2250594 RepID=A0ABV7DDB3_9HYPH|nr:uroporphyrinogen-III synthase [Shinella pollutisoli]
MRVLVTRPQQAAARTAAKLAALGHEPVLLPLSRAVHDRAAAAAALCEPFSAIAVTSAEAAGLLGDAPPGARQRADIPVYAVGHASADAVRAAGFGRVATAGGDGRDLAGLILREKPDFSAGPLLYLAGDPRAPGFESRLREAGVPFRTVECYRMEPLVPAAAEIGRALLSPPPDAVILYSRETAARFFALVPERFPAARMLCMSRNVAAAVPARFAAGVAVAASPDEESLLALLQVPAAPE